VSAARSADAPTWPRRLLAGLVADDYDAHVANWGALPGAGGLSGPALLEIVESSGLLGRGGAGFPTGRKMRTVAAGASRRPVVVANGAEGEPASGKDALLLGRAPHLVLDGIQLAARAVGADEAHLAVHRGSPVTAVVRAALACRGRTDRVPLQVHEIPSRYVASEETSLIHYVNGGDARPTFTPPRPFEQGVGRRPTLVNNVETLAHVAAIARNGADWFRAVGDHDEPGTLLVSISADRIARRVAEVPTGTTIGAVADRAGIDREGVAAVLVGGYFGSWLPAAYAWQLPLTHRAMRSAGAALGAGVLAVLPAATCGLVETARVMSFLAAHNAGQCGPCLNGLPAIADAMRRLATGGWDDRTWPALERWLSVVPGRGACRHPDGAVRFAATALSVFADDVARHRSGRPCASARAAGSPGAGWLPVPAPTGGWR
jgi:NADH:ubiquinone oxidoreductase subunit F (NADH-binding)